MAGGVAAVAESAGARARVARSVPVGTGRSGGGMGEDMETESGGETLDDLGAFGVFGF